MRANAKSVWVCNKLLVWLSTYYDHGEMIENSQNLDWPLRRYTYSWTVSFHGKTINHALIKSLLSGSTCELSDIYFYAQHALEMISAHVLVECGGHKISNLPIDLIKPLFFSQKMNRNPSVTFARWMLRSTVETFKWRSPRRRQALHNTFAQEEWWWWSLTMMTWSVDNEIHVRRARLWSSLCGSAASLVTWDGSRIGILEEVSRSW